MKILYIHQYFKTPKEGGSIRSYYLAKGLVDAGHDVTMITAHNDIYQVKNVEKISVHYLPVKYDNRLGFFDRLIAFGKFVRQARAEALKLPKQDLAYVMTTPLTTGFIATYLKRRTGLPYYFEVGDLWPEVPIKMGVIKSRLLKRWLYALEKKFYFEAEKVIALSPAIRNYIEKISPQTKVHVIPNIADCSYFESAFSVGDFSERNKFQITYCGTIGKANHLEFLLDAARKSELSQLPIHFNIMGCGSELNRHRNRSRRAKNITFYPHSSKKCVKNLLNRSDAVYVSFKDVDALGTGSPNKLFDSFAAGKLTIINFNGWIKDVLNKNKCGFYYDPHAPEEFIRKIQAFINSPQLLSTYQGNGRKLAELYFDKKIQVMKLLKVLNSEYKFEMKESEFYILTA